MILGFLKSTWAIIAKPCLLTLKRLEGVGKGGGAWGPPGKYLSAISKPKETMTFHLISKALKSRE